MKLLKIEGGLGYFLAESGEYHLIEKISKNDLFRLVDQTLGSDVEIDEYAEASIKNHAHQIVYKGLYEKLHGLRDRKKEFLDESERLFLDDYERYKASLA